MAGEPGSVLKRPGAGWKGRAGAGTGLMGWVGPEGTGDQPPAFYPPDWSGVLCVPHLVRLSSFV